MNKRISGRGANSFSFNPDSSTGRPDMRVIYNNPKDGLPRLSDDDVVIIPNFFNSTSIYAELRSDLQKIQDQGVKNSEYIDWHESSHLISKNPDTESFHTIVRQMAQYYHIDMSRPHATRFNLYDNAETWKSHHHDSAAFNKKRADDQNITITATFTDSNHIRELQFLHATTHKTINFPMNDNTVCSFGSSVNRRWMHGIVALTASQKLINTGGRISIVLWGYCKLVDPLPGDPAMIPERTTRRNIQRIQK